MSQIIQLKRGLEANLANVVLKPGEVALTTDSKKLAFGLPDGTKAILSDVHYGSTAPANAEAHKIWVDTATNVIKRSVKDAAGVISWVEVNGFIENSITAAASTSKVYSSQAVRDILAGYYTQVQIDEFLNTLDVKINDNKNRIVTLEGEVQGARSSAAKSTTVTNADGTTTTSPKVFVDVDARIEEIENEAKTDAKNLADYKAANDTKNNEQDSRLTNVEGKNAEQDNRLTSVEGVNTDQENRLKSAEGEISGARSSSAKSVTNADGTTSPKVFTNVDSRLEEIENDGKNLNGKIDKEISDRQAADSALDQKFSPTKTEVEAARTGYSADGATIQTFSSLDARVDTVDQRTLDEIARAKKAEADLDAKKANLAGAVFTGPVSAPEPVEAGHVATKNYVDNIASGISMEKPVRVVSETNLVLVPTTKRTSLTIDGVALAAGDRVLVIGQTTAAQNGVYVVEADFDLVEASDVYAAGSVFFVNEGTKFNNSGFIADSLDSFSQFTGGAQLTAAQGLYKNGNELGIADGGVSNAKLAAGSVSIDKLGFDVATQAELDVVKTDLTNETNARTAADNKLQTNIDNLKAEHDAEIGKVGPSLIAVDELNMADGMYLQLKVDATTGAKKFVYTNSLDGGTF